MVSLKFFMSFYGFFDGDSETFTWKLLTFGKNHEEDVEQVIQSSLLYSQFLELLFHE